MSLLDNLPEPIPTDQVREFETALAKKIAKGDEDALNSLVMANMREAVLYCRVVAREADDGVLMSVCYEALMASARCFNPAGIRFFAFSKARLRGAFCRKFNKEMQQQGNAPQLTGQGPKRSKVNDYTSLAMNDYDMPEYDPIGRHGVTEADEQGIITRDDWEHVQPLVEEFCSDQEKMVLTLAYVTGFNFQEIGRLFDVTRSAIQRTHWRAIKKLRIELARRKQLFS